MKRCELCKQPFKRRKSESNYAFRRRSYCSEQCVNLHEYRQNTRAKNLANLVRELSR